MTVSAPPSGTATAARAGSGVPGLDSILGGGFIRNRLYLVDGAPGSGKTTIGLQFLLEGARRAERLLYISLSETRHELEEVAVSHGWSLDGVELLEPVPADAGLDPDRQVTMFHPSDVELGETIRVLLERVKSLEPTRVVIDSVSDLRLMVTGPLQYRRQVRALKEFFAGRNCTLLVIDDRVADDDDLNLRTIAHGLISLEQLAPEYGAERRRLKVVKYRGAQFRGGYHDFIIRRGGVRVFPRLVTAEGRHPAPLLQLSTGISALDALLGGGIERGTTTLITGGPGLGKSSLAAQFAVAAAQNGGKAAIYAYDESRTILFKRCDGLGIPLRAEVEAGRVMVRQIDPAELSPGELAHQVCEVVENDGVTMIVIDSLNGYLNALPEERFLTLHLHQLLSVLSHLGVATVLVGVQQGTIGAHLITPADASYLADTVIMLRHFEALGEVRQAISVFKKRSGGHEHTIREFRMRNDGIRVGEPLRAFRGVLTGVPTYGDGELLTDRDGA